MPSSGPDEVTQTNKSEPWGPSHGNLIFGMDEVRKLYESGGLSPAPFEGPRVAGFGDATTAAQQGIIDIAGTQGAGLSTATGTVIDMAQGDDGIYRDMDAVRQSTLEGVMPSVMNAFGGAGMADSSVARQEAATAATTALAPIEYGAYNQAKDRSLRAASMVPGMMQAQYIPQQMIGQVGAAQDAMDQANINADMSAYYEGQNQDLTALQNYTNMMLGYGGQGGTVTSTGPGTGPSGFGQFVGAGLAGLGTYGALAGIGPMAVPLGILAGLGSL